MCAVGCPLKTRPRGSTAAAFHGLSSAKALTYYSELAGGAPPRQRWRSLHLALQAARQQALRARVL